MEKVLMISTVASTIDMFNRNNLIMLKKLGYEVIVAANFGDENPTHKEKTKDFIKYLVENKISYYNIDFSRSPLNISSIKKSFVQINELLSKNTEIKFIHVHTPIASLVTRVIASKYKVPVIYHVHGYHFYKGAPLKNWALFYPIEKLMVKKTNAVITINKEDYEQSKKMGFNKTYYVPGVGLNLETNHDSKNIEKLINKYKLNGELVITSIGELNKNKNHSVVLEALSNLKDLNFNYLVCGVGTEKDNLLSLAEEYNISNKVHLLGYRTDIDEILHVSDVFVFMSYREGLSVSLMEAMKNNTAIIASDIRGNNDLIDSKGGYLIKPNDADALSEKIKELYNKRELIEELSGYNKMKVTKFSDAIVKEKMRKIYVERGEN